MPSPAIYQHQFQVSEDWIDRNQHVNNVVYLEWMQSLAILHSASTGGAEALKQEKASWFARSHHIEYLAPSFLHDSIVALTWVHDFGRSRTQRRYRFFRESDGRLISRGETEWIFVDAQSGRPRKIPEHITSAYTLLPEEEEPRSLL